MSIFLFKKPVKQLISFIYNYRSTRFKFQRTFFFKEANIKEIKVDSY
jgi:hypothetical protein